MIISIIAPCRNEVLYIDKFIEAVLGQECKNFKLEIVIADGLSDDGTQEKLVAWARKETRLRVICNPGRIVSTGLNLALNNARGEIVVRMDIHTQYSKDYVSECVRSLSVTDAQCVGGPWVAFGYTPLQRAIASAFQSSIGSGGAASRQIDFSGWVDTVYLGAWRKSYILDIGGFDEALVRNQDDELCLRIVRQGGRIYQSSTIRSVYVPRDSFGALFRQFSQYGYWKIPVIRKHHLPASIRHVAPFVFIAVLALVAGASIFVPLAGWLLL
jgi:succinoglycan biosynthesis protein ExoA